MIFKEDLTLFGPEIENLIGTSIGFLSRESGDKFIVTGVHWNADRTESWNKDVILPNMLRQSLANELRRFAADLENMPNLGGFY